MYIIFNIHIYIHLPFAMPSQIKSRSNEVMLHAESPLGEITLECFLTGAKNVFQLGFVPVKEDLVVLLARDVEVIWPLQDIVVLWGSCARINPLWLLPPHPHCPHLQCYRTTIARYRTPHRPCFCMPYTMQYWSWQYRVKAKR